MPSIDDLIVKRNIVTDIIRSWPKGLLIALAALIGQGIGGAVALLGGLGDPALPEGVDIISFLFVRVITGSVLYTFSGLFFMRIRLCRNETLLLGLAFNYVLIDMMNALEGAFFTDMVSLPQSMVTALFESMLVGFLLSLLFRTHGETVRFKNRVSNWKSTFSTPELVLRLTGAWLAFPVIYLTFGALIAPLVMPYYQNHTFGLQLPDMSVIISLQIFRGGLILLFSLPFIALWREDWKRFILWFGLLLFFKDVVLALGSAIWYSPYIRIVHGTELIVDGFVLALVYAFLLVKGRV